MEIGFWVVLALLLYMVVTYSILVVIVVVVEKDKAERINVFKSIAVIAFWAISIPCVFVSLVINALKITLKSWIRDRRAIRKIKRARREGKSRDEM